MPQELKNILEKPEWTYEDKRILLSLLESLPSDVLQKVLNESAQSMQLLKKDDKDISIRMLQEIHKKIGKDKQVNARVRNMRFMKIVAAAAILLAFVSGIWIYIEKNKKSPEIIEANKVIDVAPGSNKAILTLADGTTIVLDSANNGAVAAQGNVEVIKLEDGQLSYKGTAGSALIYNSIQTPKGGQHQLILADGTKVWLNAESSLRFPASFVGKEREVELSGEGYFEVAKNAAQPFYVKVGAISVQVLGTHFNINSYSDEKNIATTLLEGKVKVNNGISEIELKPGQQAQASNIHLKKLYNVDMDEIMAWKNGAFVFNETELKDAMKLLSRWYNIEIVYENKLPVTYLYGSISRKKSLIEVLKIMESSGLKFKIEKAGTINKLYILK